MKLITLAFILFFLIGKLSNAEQYNYECELNVWFKNGIDGDFKTKIINMNLSSHDGEYIKIFDKEIGLYYTPDFYIFDNDDEYLHAVAVSQSKGLRSLKFDKSIKYLQWTALSSSGGTTVHFGFCK